MATRGLHLSFARLAIATLLGAAVVAPIACGETDTEAETKKVHAKLEPAAPILTRLTASQYKYAISDLLGEDVTLPAQLEPDAKIDGLLAVGASVTSLSPRGVELYEEAALKLAFEVMSDAQRRARIMPCGAEAKPDETCLAKFATTFGRRLWRRPLDKTEVATLVAVGSKATKTLEKEPHAGAQYLLAALLQSPHFLYRVESGEAVADTAGARRYSNYEMATRLALLLHNTTPDDALLEAAEKGELTSDAGLQVQVDRLLADARFGRAVRNFVSDWLHLGELDQLSKDPTVFKHYSTNLGEMAREETLRLAMNLVVEEDSDFRAFLTTRTSWVSKRLAALYNVPATAEDGFGRIELPANGARAGYLGHVSFLALNAHPVFSSPTLRGIFVREVLLCETVPLPPSGLNTALPPPSGKARTLRERLDEHMADPSCKGCHAFIDKIGFGFEEFNGIGRFQDKDNGQPIDASGSLDHKAFNNARELGTIIAHSDKFRRCVTEKLYSYAIGRSPSKGEHGEIERLVDGFADGGYRLKALFAAIATSEGFRTLAGGK